MKRAVKCLLLTFTLLRRSQPRSAPIVYDPQAVEAWRAMIENAERVS